MIIQTQRRFVIATDSAKGVMHGVDVIDRNKITDYLKLKGFDVWHWFEDIWLVVDPSSSATPLQIRSEIGSLVKEGRLKHVLVMQIDGPVAYSGLGPPSGWGWMAEKWGTPQ